MAIYEAYKVRPRLTNPGQIMIAFIMRIWNKMTVQYRGHTLSFVTRHMFSTFQYLKSYSFLKAWEIMNPRGPF